MLESGQSWKTAALRVSGCVCFLFWEINMEKYMLEAIKEAKKAGKKGDVPVGAIVVLNNKVIARAHNMKEYKSVGTYHAEILAINKACTKLKTWHLEECVLYVTMEPCMMCCGAIEQVRIKKIVYGTDNINFGYTKMLNQKIEIENKFCQEECKSLIQSFFVEKRK